MPDAWQSYALWVFYGVIFVAILVLHARIHDGHALSRRGHHGGHAAQDEDTHGSHGRHRGGCC